MAILLGKEDDVVSSIGLTKENVLSVTTWDGGVSVYDVKRDAPSARVLARRVHESPILACCDNSGGGVNQWFIGDVLGRLYVGDLTDGDYSELNFQEIALPNNFQSDVDNGKSGLCKIKRFADHRSVISASWNGNLNIVDTRLMHSVSHANINRKIFTMDFNDNSQKVCCVSASQVVDIRDIRKLDKPYELRDSGLKDQIRDLQMMPTGEGYAQCSIAGRIAMEYFADSSKNYGFRCHRQSLKDSTYVYPVNSISFQENSDVVFSGGSDGKVSIWDYKLKKRLSTLNEFQQQSVVKLANNNEFLAIACSDDSFKTDPLLEPLEGELDDYSVMKSHIYLHRL